MSDANDSSRLLLAHARAIRTLGGTSDDVLEEAARLLVTQCGDTWAGAWRLPSRGGAPQRRAAYPTPMSEPPSVLPRASAVRAATAESSRAGPEAPDGVRRWTIIAAPLRTGAGLAIVIGTAGVLSDDMLDAKVAFVQAVAGLVGADEAAQRAHRSATSLRAQKKRLLRILDASPMLVSLHEGADHKITFVNKRFKEAAGGRGLVGKTYSDAFPEFVDQGYLSLFDRVYTSGESFSSRGARADVVDGGGDRRERYFDYTFQPLTGTSGDPNGVITHAVEVTELVVGKREAERERAHLHSLLENLDALVWEAVASEDRFRFVIGRAEGLLGVRPSELVAPGRWNQMVSEPDRERVEAARRSGVEYDVEYRAQAADGTTIWLHERAEPVPGTSPVRLRGLTVDITERREAEKDRAKLQERLLQGQKLEGLGLLAGGIAHDFNNLLTAMLGNASLAQIRLPIDSPVRENIDALEQAAERAAELTRQMLAYSGRGRFVVEVVDLAERTKQIVALLRASMPKSVRLDLDLVPGQARIRVDVAQLQQVVMNLVLNAAESVESGAGVVSVSTSRELVGAAVARSLAPGTSLKPGMYAVLDVTDTGCGMDAQTAARIFDPFFSRKPGGRGLGLAAVLGIVRGHGGAVQVRSSPGAGSTFRVYLPEHIHDDPDDHTAPPIDPTRIKRGRGVVLVVDDEAPVRTTARSLLEFFGYRVLEAADGVEGVEIFSAHAPEIDAVLLDMTMPRMGGEQAFEAMRRIRPSVPVILSSGYTEAEQVARRALKKGLAGFLHKPYTATQLQEALEKVVIEVDTTSDW